MSAEFPVLASAIVGINHGGHEEPQRITESGGGAWPASRSAAKSYATNFLRSAPPVSSHGSVALRGSSCPPWLSLTFVSDTPNAGRQAPGLGVKFHHDV